LTIFTPISQPILEKLREVDLNRLTPLEALKFASGTEEADRLRSSQKTVYRSKSLGRIGGVTVRTPYACTVLIFAITVWANAQTDNPPPGVDPHFQAALGFEKRGEADKAIEEYEQAIKDNPDHADSHYNLANLLCREARLPECNRSVPAGPADQSF